MRLGALFALVLLAGTAHAATPYDLYAAGHYDEAMRLGDQASTDATTLTIAARAALADAVLRTKPCLECLHRAEEFAAHAIETDPKAVDGHVYHAIAMGLQARIIGPVLARLRNYPGRAKDDLDAALAVDPGSASALSSRGGWNIEIVRAAGATLADLFYGATLEKGIADFSASFAREPGNVTIRYQYALSMGGLDAERYNSQIQGALDMVVSGMAKTEYERAAQRRAAELLRLLEQKDVEGFRDLVRVYQGYP